MFIKTLLRFNYEKCIIPNIKELTSKRKKKCINCAAMTKWLNYGKYEQIVIGVLEKRIFSKTPKIIHWFLIGFGLEEAHTGD